MRFRINDLGIDVATEAEAQQALCRLSPTFCQTTCSQTVSIHPCTALCSLTPTQACGGAATFCQTTCSHTVSIHPCTAMCSLTPTQACGGAATFCQTTCSHTVSIHPCTAMCSLTPTQACGGAATFCQTTCSHTASIHVCTAICSFGESICQAGCSTAAPSIPAPVHPGDPVEQLGAVRAQLEAALEQVKQQQAAQDEAMQPQTVEQVDLLTGKLEEAMAALRARRDELAQRQASSEGSTGSAGQ